jgi:3-methyladenine DNA glycosylase AlkD
MRERQEQCESWKVTDMQIPGRERFTDQLKGLAEEQYRIFNQKFVLTNRNPMLGVKVPKMRGVAREIVAGGSWRKFLAGYGFVPQGSAEELGNICSGVFFEEIMIIGMVINLANMQQGERLALVELFVPLIDNWAVCDVFCGGAKWVGEPGRGPKASLRVPREVVWNFLQGYILGDVKRGLSGRKEFEIRFGVVMLMCRFLNEKYLPRVFEVLKSVEFGAYYVDMAVAWCLASARAKFDVPVQDFVAGSGLPAGVVKKYEQKVRDSLRMRRISSSR